ncbi:hypothetical protein Tco_0911818 [Tanacetum coccineum]
MDMALEHENPVQFCHIQQADSDVQSAFVSNRQILDGPFILNELISWCKAHKSKAMIFKVDFEKAFDLWRKIARWWEIDIPDFSCYEEWIAWFKTTRFSKAQKEMLEGVFYVMWWMIWKSRNQVLFGSSHPRMELLFDDIVSYSFTWCSNRCKNNIDWISWMKCPKSISL